MNDRINAHYGREGLEMRILAGLEAAGVDPNNLSPEDLAPADQFHIGARESTMALVELAGLRPDMQVLDVGGGLGGPARTLATEAGCHVTVLDLTEEYCVVGTSLTARCRLNHLVGFRHGDATDMHFRDEQFDAVWTQHSAMNISDKKRLYAECRRVLKDGGRLAFHEVLAGPEQPIHFPVPWAGDESISFLHTPEELRSVLAETGFKEVAWDDATAESIAWWAERKTSAPADGPPPLGLHLLLGAEMPTLAANVVRNLDEQRIRVVRGVFERGTV